MKMNSKLMKIMSVVGFSACGILASFSNAKASTVGLYVFPANILEVHAVLGGDSQNNVEIQFTLELQGIPSEDSRITFAGARRRFTLPVCDTPSFSIITPAHRVRTTEGLLSAVSSTNHLRRLIVVISDTEDGRVIIVTPVCIAQQHIN